MKARSEFVTPTNFSDGGVVETLRMFHAASAASMRPARRPMRGSGLGGSADIVAGAAPASAVDVDEEAQAAAESAASASDRMLRADAMPGSCWSRRWVKALTEIMLIGRRLRTEGSRAST